MNVVKKTTPKIELIQSGPMEITEEFLKKHEEEYFQKIDAWIDEWNKNLEELVCFVPLELRMIPYAESLPEEYIADLNEKRYERVCAATVSKYQRYEERCEVECLLRNTALSLPQKHQTTKAKKIRKREDRRKSMAENNLSLMKLVLFYDILFLQHIGRRSINGKRKIQIDR